MANNYNGFLLKFGSEQLPNEYFLEYESTPDQRLESSAERDNNGLLHRFTLPNGKSGMVFSTHILNLDEKIRLQRIFLSGLVDFTQRKYSVTYWNDEINNYDSGLFYMPDIKYQIMEANKTDILYNPITVELIEY